MSNLAEKNVKVAPVVGLIPETPYNRIMSFINNYESKNTRDTYTRHYKLMFEYMTGKKGLERVTYEDIKSINDIKVEGFRNQLKDKYKSTTINQIIFSCKALFDKFKERRIIEINDFDLEPLIEKENSYGSLTNKEIENLFDYCLNLDYKPMITKLYFEFLYKVTCRKSAVQDLIWDQFNKELDRETETMIWVITFVDKGKEIKKAITDEFYERLKQNYNENNKKNDGKIFCGIDNGTYDKVLKDYCKKYGIDQKRNITQHSIKGSGLDHIMTITGDINTVSLAGQHKSVNMAFKRYLNKNRRFSEHPSYFLGKSYDIDMLRSLSKDKLLKLIEGSGNETVIRLCLEMEKLNK